MEEQAANCTVFFKNGPPSLKPQMEEERIYCNVKIKAPAAALKSAPDTAQMEEERIYCNVEIKAPAAALKSAPDTGDKEAVHGRDFYVLAAVLVFVCVLLLGSIAVLVYLAITMTNQRAENLQLMEQRDVLQNRTQVLSRENELLNMNHDLSQQGDSLNWTPGVIKAFECQLCPKKWIPFKDHCYFFFNDAAPWKRWDQSRTYCKSLNPISDLVVIESLEEQEFIHNRIKYYYDEFHGFWIGLSQNANNDSWVWVDGQTDTLRFWMKKDFGTPAPKALMIPNRPLTESWAPAQNAMQNKFICESKALIKE